MGRTRNLALLLAIELLSFANYCDGPHGCHPEDEQPDFRAWLPGSRKSAHERSGVPGTPFSTSRARALKLKLRALGCNLVAGTAGVPGPPILRAGVAQRRISRRPNELSQI